MKYASIIILSCLCIVSPAFAQDLDTVTVSDQFDSGARGNETGSLTYGAPATDGSEYEDISDVDGVSGTIRYINGFAGASAGEPAHPEAPVIDCTAAHDNPDRDLTDAIPAIPANTRPGASSPANVVLVADDGGWNGLFLGESDDSNYFIEIDAYCYDQSAYGTDVYENIMLSARAARNDDPNMTDYSFNLDRAGSYCLMYDSVLKKVQAIKWGYGHSYTSIAERDPSNYTEYGTVESVSEGWHTFRIECYESIIRYYFDGSLVAEITDTDYTFGRPGFGYREYGLDSTAERQGHFDNLEAGPFFIPGLGAQNWALYE